MRSLATFPGPIAMYQRPRKGIKLEATRFDRDDDDLFAAQASTREYTPKEVNGLGQQSVTAIQRWASPVAATRN